MDNLTPSGMLDSFEHGMPDFAPDCKYESPRDKIEWTLAEAAKMAEPHIGTQDYEWESEEVSASSKDGQDIFKEIVFLLQVEQMQTVSSMDQFTQTMSAAMMNHQKQVEKHHSKQLELLRRIATMHNADEGWPLLASGVVESVDIASNDVAFASPKSASHWYNVVGHGLVPEQRTSKNSSGQKDTAIHRAYQKAKSATLHQNPGEFAILMTLEKTGLDKMGYKSKALNIMSRSKGCRDALFECMSKRRMKLYWLEFIVEHSLFKLIIVGVIMANALCIAAESGFAVGNSFDSFDSRAAGGTEVSHTPPWLESADYVFFAIYLAELLARGLGHEGALIVGPEWRWNIFDITVVVLAGVELVLEGVASPTVVRLLRLVKISRSIRTLRLLRFVPSLYPLQVLMLSCNNSLAALFWSSMFMVLLILIFAVIFISGAKTYVDAASAADAHVETLREHFSSLPMAMLSLFLAFLGEAEFKEMITVLLEVSVWYCVLFFLFVLFVTLAITNVIAGIFVTDALEMASRDREIRQRGELVRARKNMQVLSTLFQELDYSGSGVLNRNAFHEQVQRPEVQALFSHFDFDIMDADSFFTLLDADGNGTVDIEEFVVGCLRMHGKSNAIDMEISIHETKSFVKQIVKELIAVKSSGVQVGEEVHEVHLALSNLEAVLASTGCPLHLGKRTSQRSSPHRSPRTSPSLEGPILSFVA